MRSAQKEILQYVGRTSQYQSLWSLGVEVRPHSNACKSVVKRRPLCRRIWLSFMKRAKNIASEMVPRESLHVLLLEKILKNT